MTRLPSLTEQECQAFEQSVAPGDLVTAVWKTLGEFPCAAQARILARKPKTWIAELTEPIDGFESGQQRLLPRIGSAHYERYRRILPDTLVLTNIDIRDIPAYCRVRGRWMDQDGMIQVQSHWGNNRTEILFRRDESLPWQPVNTSNFNVDILAEKGNGGDVIIIEAHAHAVHEEMIAPQFFWYSLLAQTRRPHILVPYAGSGDLVKLLSSRLMQAVLDGGCDDYELRVCESDRARVWEGIVRVFRGDFLSHRPGRLYHAVVNPLFHQCDFLRQFQHMWRCLAPGGVLVTLAPDGITRRTHPYQTLCSLLEAHQATFLDAGEALPRGSCLLHLVKVPGVHTEAFSRGAWIPEAEA